MRKYLLVFLIILFLGNREIFASDLKCDSILKRGSKGDNVSVLQKKLNEYMDCGLAVDGIFGSKTYACVVRFQQEFDLEVDGIVGKNTCKKLNSSLVVRESDFFGVDDGVVVLNDETLIRKKVDDSSEFIGSFMRGDVLEYVRKIKKGGNTWYYVKALDELGYVKASEVSGNAILVDISEQKVVYFKGKKIILEADVVTGKLGSNDTPYGKYTLKVDNKQRSRTLRGYNADGSKYAAYVDYWMPFIMDRGIGFHDASWRVESEFNSSTYIYDGSHGCINMKKDDAYFLYSNIKKDTVVIVRK